MKANPNSKANTKHLSASSPADIFVWVVIIGILIVTSCQKSYDLDGEDATWDEPLESTDGSWAAALEETVLPVIFEDDTEYASGFDEVTFRNLPMGINQAKVEEDLGPPISKKTLPDGYTYWYYSESRETTGNHFLRILVFNSAGELLGRRGSFCVH